MGAPHDWDWASPSITSGPSLPPGQPSTGPHIGYGGGQQTQVTAPPVQTGTPNFGPHGSGGANQPPSTTIDNTSEIISDAGWDALTNAGNIDNNIGTTTLADGTISVPELTTSSTKPVEPFINVYNEEVDLTNISDDIWDLAVQASTSPGYELSHEGQGLMNEGIMPGSAEWVTHFGLPQIVGTSTSGIPVTSGGYTDEYGQEIPSDIVMTGLGQALLDQYDDPTGSYEEMADDYWEIRGEEQAQQGEGPGWEDYGDYYDDRPPSLAEWARQHWFSESLGDVEAKEAQRQAEGLGAATMSNMDRMYTKDFAAADIGPDPFFDPEYSYEYFKDYDPIFAGMQLFEKARS